MNLRPKIIFTLLVAFFCFNGEVKASTITTGENCSFVSAIASAETDSQVSGCVSGYGSDVIVLGQDEVVSSQTVLISSDITIQGGGHVISFESPSDIPGRVFTVSGGSLRVYETEFIAIENQDFVVEDGGFMFAEDSDIYLNNTTVKGFRAMSFGGAMNIVNTNLEIQESIFSDNSQIQEGYILGGGVLFVANGEGSIRISNSTFTRNSAEGQGGAILRLGGDFQIINSQFTKNKALHGSAINASSWNEESYFEITDSSISRNLSEQGGAFVWKGPLGEVTINKSIFEGNTSLTAGAGFEIYGTGEVSIINSTFSGNSSKSDGSAIFSHTNDAVLKSAYNTFVSNYSGGNGGAIANSNLATWSRSVIENSIFYKNIGGDCHFYSTENLSVAGNLSSGGICGNTAPSGVDSLLGLNGGTTKTHKLLNGSNAIDTAVTDMNIVEIPCQATDQRGAIRPIDGNNDGIAKCDVGAYEYKRVTTAPALKK